MFKQVREGIIRCILATDMAKHNEILNSFKDLLPTFDFSNKDHKNQVRPGTTVFLYVSTALPYKNVPSAKAPQPLFCFLLFFSCVLVYGTCSYYNLRAGDRCSLEKACMLSGNSVTHAIHWIDIS